jgi:hypothetical protein
MRYTASAMSMPRASSSRAVDRRAEVLAVDVLHHDEVAVVGAQELVDLRDVGVHEQRRELVLGGEHPHEGRVLRVHLQHALHGHEALVAVGSTPSRGRRRPCRRWRRGRAGGTARPGASASRRQNLQAAEVFQGGSESREGHRGPVGLDAQGDGLAAAQGRAHRGGDLDREARPERPPAAPRCLPGRARAVRAGSPAPSPAPRARAPGRRAQARGRAGPARSVRGRGAARRARSAARAGACSRGARRRRGGLRLRALRR